MTSSRTSSAASKRDLVALLGALCMALSAVEYMIPKPVPFLRVGIANLPILIGLDLLPFPLLALVAVLKVVGQGLVGGTLASYVVLFSAAGTFTSLLSMWTVRRLFPSRMTLLGVSVVGALAGNCAQLLLSRVLLFGEGTWLIAAPFLVIGTLTAAVLGSFAERFAARSAWWNRLRGTV